MKKMKTMMILFSMFMLILSSTSVLSAETMANIDVVLLTYNPSPAEPGSYVDIELKATNIGSMDANNVVFELVPEYPFSADPSEEIRKEFGTVGAKQELNLEFTVRIDPKAVFRETPLKLRYTTDGAGWTTKNLMINVKTSEAILLVDEISTPDTLIPGESSKVDINLVNLAESTLKDVTLKLDLSTETATTASGIVTRDLPFIPVDSGMEQKVKFLTPGENKRFSFNLLTYADAESKVYKIPMIISFKDESGTEYTKEDILGVVVGAEPRLTLGVDENNLKGMNAPGDVTLKIVNKGVTDIKFLTASVANCDGGTVDCDSQEIYVGDVDSDDYELIDFRITPKQEELKLELDLDYADANNKKYEETMTVDLSVNPANQNSSGSWFNIVVIGALIIGGIVFWRKRKHKHKKD